MLIPNVYSRLNRKVRSLIGLPDRSDVISILAHQLMTAEPMQSHVTLKCLLKGCHVESNSSQSYVASEWVCHPVYLLEASNSYINIDTGVVFLNNCKKYILETSWGWAKYRTSSVSALDTSKIYNLEDSEPSYIASGFGYHGIVEDLSVMILIARLGFKFRVVTSENNKWLINLIILYFPGITVLPIPKGSWVSGGTNLISTKSSFGEFVHPELIRILNRAPLEILGLAENDNINKIFISRGDSENRSYDQERLVSQIFLEAGYEIIRLAEYSVLDQVNMFFNATHIAGLHGAGFVNTVWCRRKVKVWEFFHRNHFNSCYSSLCHLLGHEYANYDLGWYQGTALNTLALNNIARTLICTDYLD